MSNTLRAFSQNDFDLLQTLSTAAQRSSLVLVTGGMLTDGAKQFINHSLASIRIPANHHAKVMFAVSAAAYAVHRSLFGFGILFASSGF